MIILSCLWLVSSIPTTAQDLKSPDGNLQMKFALQNDGTPGDVLAGAPDVLRAVLRGKPEIGAQPPAHLVAIQDDGRGINRQVDVFPKLSHAASALSSFIGNTPPRIKQANM